jgi:hypothetical protein
MEKEQIVLKVKLSPKPYLQLTDEQVKKMLEWNVEVTKTIFNNQADWFGIYDEAEIIQKGYEEYLEKLFQKRK